MNKLSDVIRKTPQAMPSGSIMEGLQILPLLYDANQESQRFVALDYARRSINPLAPNQDRELLFAPGTEFQVSYTWDGMTGDPVSRLCAVVAPWSSNLQSDPPIGQIPEGVPVTVTFPILTVYDEQGGTAYTFTPDPIEITYMLAMTEEP